MAVALIRRFRILVSAVVLLVVVGGGYAYLHNSSANSYRDKVNKLHTKLVDQEKPLLAAIETDTGSKLSADLVKATKVEQAFLTQLKAITPPANLKAPVAALIAGETDFIGALQTAAQAARSSADPAAATAAITALTTAENEIQASITQINNVS